ncbi:hypothetical protein ACKKBF_B30895 [Auxenochlorella protothecoides x Auxenochlorella symbiontica]
MAVGPTSNVYTAAKNNPEVLGRRRRRVEALESRMTQMVTENCRRRPSWPEEKIRQMDQHCRLNGLRCIMWDDEAAGFYLLLKWDWVCNRPAQPTEGSDANGPGWWCNVKHIVGLPLLDPSLPDEGVAAWIDEHTMAIHS